MRKLEFKPKVARRVAIPSELREFFVYTRSLIEAGDSAAVLTSDDLIQTRCAYGGRVEEGGDRYAFTYFPGSHTRPYWEFEATVDGITAMAGGQITHLDLWGCTNPECADLFSSYDDVCMYCDYMDEERDARQRVLPSLAGSASRAEWVSGYLRHFPDDDPMLIIGAYNGQPGLGERLGWFTSEEMQSLVAKVRGEAEVRG